MISSSKLQTLPELFNITLPDTLSSSDSEGMILGLWGPLIHQPPTQQQQQDQIDPSSASSSRRVLYLVLKCQSLYQSLNTVNETSDAVSQSQAIFKCATIVTLLSQCLTVCTDIPLDRTSEAAPSPLPAIQQQSSQIISSFLISLSLSCSQLTEAHQLTDITLQRKRTAPPSLCLLREFTQQLQSAHRTSPSLRSLYASLLTETTWKYFHQNSFYLQDLCLDPPSSEMVSTDVSPSSDPESGGVTVSGYDSFAKILSNLLIAQQRESDPQEQSENGPYLVELTQIYVSYVEPFYKDQSESGVVGPQQIARDMVRKTLTESTSPIATLTTEQEAILSLALERYKTILAEAIRLAASSDSAAVERTEDPQSVDNGYQGSSGNL
jgi:hypothetical protein